MTDLEYIKEKVHETREAQKDIEKNIQAFLIRDTKFDQRITSSHERIDTLEKTMTEELKILKRIMYIVGSMALLFGGEKVQGIIEFAMKVSGVAI